MQSPEMLVFIDGHHLEALCHPFVMHAERTGRGWCGVVRGIRQLCVFWKWISNGQPFLFSQTGDCVWLQMGFSPDSVLLTRGVLQMGRSRNAERWRSRLYVGLGLARTTSTKARDKREPYITNKWHSKGDAGVRGPFVCFVCCVALPLSHLSFFPMFFFFGYSHKTFHPK